MKYKGLSAAVFALVSTLALSSPVAAAGLLRTVPAAEAQNAASQGPDMGTLVRRSRIVRLDTGELARHVAPLNMDTAADRLERSKALDGVISVELFPGTTVIFRRHSVDVIGDSGYAWVGRVKGNPLHYASLIVENGEVTGHIQLHHRIFEIDPLGNGLHRVIEIDASKFPPDHPAGWRQPYEQTEEPAHDETETTTRAKTTIRVLVAYTPAARAQAGPGINNRIKQAVNLANVAYANTGIPIKVVLTRIMASGAYTEAADLAVDLNRLDGGSPILQNVRKVREIDNADLVSLWRKSDPTACGISNLTDRPTARTRNRAYNVMNWTCVSNLSFHHEMGHSMGLRHDYYVDPTPALGYNHGYVNKAAACKIRTIMAYDDDCWRNGAGFHCTRINGFSTGNFIYGGCTIGFNKSGTLTRMDNTQRLKETRTTISRYR